MAEKYELAEKDYMAGMKYKEIAEKHDVSINTVKSWKTRHKWSKDAAEKGVHTKQKRVHTKKELLEPVVESDELTEKQRLFCMYYVRSLNATSAYKKVYECSYQTAMANSSRMLSNAKVKETVAELKRQRLESLDLDKYDVLEKYKAIAFADITDFIDFSQVESEATETNVEYNPDGSKKSEKIEVVPYTYTKFAMHRSDEIDGTLITELSKGKDGMFKVKLADKMAALAFLVKYTDILSDNDKKRLQEEKLKADIAKTRSETKGTSGANIRVVDFSNLSTEELRAIANSKRRTD
ncbi:terminase small subunit [Psychrobacillus sp. FSL K6-2843]|uniref:terminase small subunit n=1 Tax=Psychrobacillus sp. FSL K6-2843 TaxID=2921549 RepID=UPI003159FF3E